MNIFSPKFCPKVQQRNNSQSVKLFEQACQGHSHSHSQSSNSQVDDISGITDANPELLVLDVEGKSISFEIDTGACATVISHDVYRINFLQVPLKVSSLPLYTATGKQIQVYGEIDVNVRNRKLKLTVIESDRLQRSLLGRDWLDKLYPEWRSPFQSLNSVKSFKSLQEEINIKFPNVISQVCEPILGYEAEIVMKDEASPIFHKAYSVPFKLRDQVSDELDRLVKENVLVPVKHSKWASPIVVVPKSNGKLRLCMDCKVTINKYVETEHYPLPRVDDIFAGLAGNAYFCVLDLAGAYQQLALSEQSQQYLTINTLKGLYRYKRLCFGVSSAPSIFQSVMDQILLNMKNVHCFFDDILIGGSTEQECKTNLFLVMSRLNDHNVKINLDKCKFLQSSVTYLGHVLSKTGIRPTDEKVEAIQNAPVPKNLSELQSYLGLLNYYSHFIPNLSSQVKDLYHLLKNDSPYVWTTNCQQAFDKSKYLLLNSNILEFYDPEKEIIVSADASPYGLGAVLSHPVEDREKPVLFASCTLSPAEKNYSQTHREALSIIFALKKFSKYLYGKKFTIYTDHQSLREIFNPRKGTPAVAAARLQRWSIQMSMYDYKIVYRPGRKMANADALSRLPIPSDTEVESSIQSIFSLNFTNEIPLSFDDVKLHTQQDPILSQVYKYVMNGFPSKIPDHIQVYKSKEQSLSTENECLFYGNRIIIPESLKSQVLESLHSNHMGIVKMKMQARSYVWWHKMCQEIEDFTKSCPVCQVTLRVPKEIVTTTWKESKYPFDRVHIDFFHFKGKEFLIYFDSYSKYCDIVLMHSTVAKSVNERLGNIFSYLGLPSKIVSDNGPPFNSYEYNKFLENHHIENLHSPPYHPQSNGSAEKSVSTVKNALKKFFIDENLSSLSLSQKIQKFRIDHNNSPSTVTKVSPNEIIFSYKPKILLDCINPKKQLDLNSKVRFENQSYYESDSESQIDSEPNSRVANQKSKVGSKSKIKDIVSECHDKFEVNDKVFNSKFKKGDRVMYRNHLRSDLRWVPGTVLKVVSRYTYLVNVWNRVRFVQENQLRLSTLKESYHPGMTILPSVDYRYYNIDNYRAPPVVKSPAKVKYPPVVKSPAKVERSVKLKSPSKVVAEKPEQRSPSVEVVTPKRSSSLNPGLIDVHKVTLPPIINSEEPVSESIKDSKETVSEKSSVRPVKRIRVPPDRFCHSKYK